ncbi:MAG: hypothetical protein HFJ51_05940 [Clostridia bacterium]|nr:hypothetical protein [Clostridia bacterium]
MIAIILIFYYINSTKEIYGYEEVINNIEEIDEKKEEVIENNIIIHITGAVINEGIVSVKETARINDAIEAAGGLREDADISNVNLAYVIEDGQKIYIPSNQDKKENTAESEIVIEDAGDKVLENEQAEKKTDLVNINKASQKELEELSGIRYLNSTKNNYI